MKVGDSMLVECKICEAVVDAEMLHKYDFYDPDYGPPSMYSFLKCPRCNAPFLVEQEDYGRGWQDACCLYPPQDKRINESFPKPIKEAYQEAIACFKGKAFTAAAIMCRKTLEGICNTHSINARNLASGLKEMKDKGIIENHLYEWADALRIFGNEAAHDVNVTISSQDAKDIVDFTDALLEYVFTFKDKFNEFTKRRMKPKESSENDTPY